MTEKKKISAIIAAVNAYMEEEAGTAKTSRMPPTPVISLWRASGRQEIMQMRALWQRRIVPTR